MATSSGKVIILSSEKQKQISDRGSKDAFTNKEGLEEFGVSSFLVLLEPVNIPHLDFQSFQPFPNQSCNFKRQHEVVHSIFFVIQDSIY